MEKAKGMLHVGEQSHRLISMIFGLSILEIHHIRGVVSELFCIVEKQIKFIQVIEFQTSKEFELKSESDEDCNNLTAFLPMGSSYIYIYIYIFIYWFHS